MKKTVKAMVRIKTGNNDLTVTVDVSEAQILSDVFVLINRGIENYLKDGASLQSIYFFESEEI